MPKLFKKLEEISTTRLSEIRKYLQIFKGIEQARYFALEMISLKSTRALYSLDTNADIVSFVEDVLEDQDPPNMLTFAYDLRFSSSQIRNGAISQDMLEGLNRSKFFNVSLDTIMNNQKKNKLSPNRIKNIRIGSLTPKNKIKSSESKSVTTNTVAVSLPIPLMLKQLTDCIRENGGIGLEGIFRISAAKEDLENLEKEIENCATNISCKDPHVAAGLIKKWIRELAEPLIPFELYTECIDFGKEYQGAHGAEKRMNEQPSSNQVAKSSNFIHFFQTRFPKNNQAVIAHLSVLINDIAQEKYNRMTIESLSIVFGPTIMVCPDQAVDPSTMLLNSKKEVSFAALLFESVYMEINKDIKRKNEKNKQLAET